MPTPKRKKQKRNRHQYSSLEPRRLLAGITLETISGRETVVIDGSAANDFAQVEDLGNRILVQLNAEEVTFEKSDVDRIRFLGRSGNDTFTNLSDVNSAAYGHSGNDVLRGGSGNNWIQGGDGNDSVFGGTRNDNLRGNGGTDTINGGERHDRIFGGDGVDTIIAENGNDFISGGEGNDEIFAGAGDDRVLGDEGDDQIDGGEGDDTLFGDEGNDTIQGRTGADRILGGTGNDELFGNADLDIIFGEEGVDEIFGGTGNDIADGGQGNDQIDLGSGSGDIAVFSGNFSTFTVSPAEPGLTVTASTTNDGNDNVRNAGILRFSDGDQAAVPNDVADLNEASEASLALLNELRQSMGLRTVRAVADLSDFATEWSNTTLNTEFRHSTEAEYGFLLEDENRTAWGENIIFTSDLSLTPQEVARQFHDAWVNSPTHFAVMTSDLFTEAGIGIVRTANGWYGTHNFSNR